MSSRSRCAACDERREDRDRCVLPGDDVGECDARLHRRSVALAGHRHPPALSLHDEVVAGTFASGSKAGDRAPDERRFLRAELLVAEVAALERPGTVILDDDVSLSGETLDELAVRREVKVGGNAQLVSVDAEEVGAFAAVIERWSPPSGLVPRAGSLDLDDVGSEIAQHHSTDWTSQHPRE